MFACSYGAAFGAIQHIPRIVPGLPQVVHLARAAQEQIVSKVQFLQEMGGLVGRVVLAFLAIRIVSRRRLLRVFQFPGLFLVPFVFFYPATHDLGMMEVGIFLAGLLTVAQFSFWGNYLPRMYPTHLRGTGESFAANIGGPHDRHVGRAADHATRQRDAGRTPFTKLAYSAAPSRCWCTRWVSLPASGCRSRSRISCPSELNGGAGSRPAAASQAALFLQKDRDTFEEAAGPRAPRRPWARPTISPERVPFSRKPSGIGLSSLRRSRGPPFSSERPGYSRKSGATGPAQAMGPPHDFPMAHSIFAKTKRHWALSLRRSRRPPFSSERPGYSRKSGATGPAQAVGRRHDLVRDSTLMSFQIAVLLRNLDGGRP